MRLRPAAVRREPDYPSRHKVFAAVGAWTRRKAGALIASSALLCGACYGASPFFGGGGGGGDPVDPATVVDDRPGPFDPYVGMGGEMMGPSFECSDVRPVPRDTIDSWGWWEGSLCGEQTGWAFHDVAEEGRYSVAIDYGAEWLTLALLAGDEELALLDEDAPAVELRLSPGRYTLAATTVDPVDHPTEWFTVSFYRVGD